MDMQLVKDISFKLMASKRSHEFKERGNKYYHGERVALLAVKLRKYILPDDDSYDNIITVAAWYHDIMNGVDNHAIEGAQKTREILSPYCSNEELNKICEIIAVHDDRKGEHGGFSKFIKIHQDADHLDHFGTFDIWTSFIYAVPHDQTINDVRDWLVNHRPKDNERYKSELNYEISRKIFDEKMEFLEYFSNRFYVEAGGGIWNEQQLF